LVELHVLGAGSSDKSLLNDGSYESLQLFVPGCDVCGNGGWWGWWCMEKLLQVWHCLSAALFLVSTHRRWKKYSRSKSVVKNGQKIHLKRAEILVVMGLCFLMGWARGNSKYLL